MKIDVQMLLDVVKGAVICEVDGNRAKYNSPDAAVAELTWRYKEVSISLQRIERLF